MSQRFRLPPNDPVRREGIAQSLTGGRRFRGTVSIDLQDGDRTDDHRLKELARRGGRWAAFWTDGSRIGNRLGAGVARVTQTDEDYNPVGWESAWYPLGACTGGTADAELYAIAAALEQALVRSRDYPLNYVRIYSDSMSNLRALESGTFRVLGPIMANDGRPLAIRRIIDYAEKLDKTGVDVELCWVRAHFNNGDMNGVADELAGTGAGLVTAPSGPVITWPGVPPDIRSMGQDVVDEWRSRGNCLRRR